MFWKEFMQSKQQERSDEKYILRFELPGHRDRLKAQAAQAKRSLNKQLLMLIEAGEAVQQAQGEVA